MRARIYTRKSKILQKGIDRPFGIGRITCYAARGYGGVRDPELAIAEAPGNNGYDNLRKSRKKSLTDNTQRHIVIEHVARGDLGCESKTCL